MWEKCKRNGSLFRAIRASIAIPGLFTPVDLDGRLLVDGGLLSPLPLAPAQYHLVEQSVVVSLNGTPASGSDWKSNAAGGGDEGSRQADDSLLQRWGQRAKEMLDKEPDDSQSFDALDAISMSIEAMQDRIGRYQVATYRPDLLIEIPVDACSVLDFHRARELIEMGYQRARQALANYQPGR